MSKPFTAVLAAGIILGLGAPIARAAHWTSKGWSDFEATAKKCDTLSAAQKQQCMKDAGNLYRASNFNCDNMAQPADKAQCQRYNEEWKSARATQPQGNTTAVRIGEPNPIPADAGDPTDKERNRDSTKQQEASPQTNTAAVRSGEPNPIPADAGDPTDKERNRDSTKQQEASPQPQKQN